MNPALAKGSTLVLIATAGYACLPILTRLVYEADSQMTAMGLVVWRFMVGVAAIWVLLLLSRQTVLLKSLNRQQLGILLGVGAIFAFAAFVAAASLERVPASTYTLLIYTYPAMVAFFNFLLGERLGKRRWGAIALALIGCSLTIGGRLEVNSLTDLFFPLLNAFFYSLYLVLAARYNQVGGIISAAVSMMGTLVALTLAIPVMGFASPGTLAGWWPLISLGVISTALPILLMFAGMQVLGSSNAAILSTVEPLMVIGLAVAFLGESIAASQVLGGGLILSSVVLLNLPIAHPND
jgi:drug/metabolite transporter (DMT)-like permease